MADNFKNIKSFWETKANIQLVDNQAPASNKTPTNRKNSTDATKQQESQLPETKPRSFTQHTSVTYQQPRQSVAQMRKNLEGKINIGIPQQNAEIVRPKKIEQPAKQPSKTTNNNEIPPFKKSVQNLQAVFSKKQMPFYQALTKQQEQRFEPLQTFKQDDYFIKTILADNQTNQKASKQETPKPQTTQKPTSKQSYIPVGEKRVLSSAMKSISLTEEERANQIIQKIFEYGLEPKEKEQEAKQLAVWNKNKKKMNLGEFDDGDD